MKPILYLLVLSVFLSLSSCTRPLPEGVLAVDASKKFELSVNGKRRGGSLFVPLVYDGTRPHSLVFVLHGAGTNADLFRKTVLLDQIAEEHDMIVVYPQGIGGRWDRGDDSIFFDTMINLFSETYNIDPQRIYATGFSAGAMRVYELAAALPGRFSAIAPVAGTLRADIDTTTLMPTSVLHIHGKKDDEVPFTGLPEWNLLSAEESVNVWKEIDGLSGEGEVFFRSRDAVGICWKGNGQSVAQVFDEENVHYWPPYASELIFDFFYNNPGRQARAVIDRNGLPLATGMGMDLQLNVLISLPENSAPVKEVVWYTNGSRCAVSDRAPWNAVWTVNLAGVRRLTATVRLADGTEIRTTRNPFLLVSTMGAQGIGTTDADTLIPVEKAWSTRIEDRSLGAENAIDGDVFTRWGSDWTDDESLTLDLGSVHTVSALALYWEMAYAREYSIEISTDTVNWALAKRETDGRGNIEFLSFPGVDARYIRIRGERRATEWGYSLFEVFVYGKSGL